MGARGPKPIDLSQLRHEADMWANILFALRDGVNGWATEVRWERQGTRWSGQMLKVPEPGNSAHLPSDMSDKMLKRFQLDFDGWQYIPPISPRKTIWDDLKKAKTMGEIRSISHRFKKWVARRRVGYWTIRGERNSGSLLDVRPHHLSVFDGYAKEILAVKTLWAYPRSQRKKSDNKRIEFFSKILAGLTQGIAPVTAIHRLAGWHEPVTIIRRAS